MNRDHDSSVLLLFNFGLMLIDPPQFDLIKCRIALDGRVMAVQLRRKIDMGVARNHYVDLAVLRGNREFIGRIHGRPRRDKRPGTDAWVCGGKLNGGKQTEQHEFGQWSSGKPWMSPNNNTKSGNDVE